MVSAMGADRRPDDGSSDAVFAAYLRAKAEADGYVAGRSELRTTIVRPGLLTDDEGTGLVRIAEATGSGSIPRADVAAVLAAVLDDAGTAGRTFEVIGGRTPISDAVAALTD